MHRNQRGFTIIEVMIVLAIAGLILLIVFLAIPALQRNSRNTRTKTQALRIVASVQQFINDNNNKVPVCGPTVASYPCKASTDPNNDPAKIMSIANVDPTDIDLVIWQPPSADVWLSTTPEYFNLHSGVQCPDPSAVTTAVDGSVGMAPIPTPQQPRSVVVLYAFEKPNGTFDVRCVQT